VVDTFVSILASEGKQACGETIGDRRRLGRFDELMACVPIHAVVSNTGSAG
jgi:hypothetical protein